MTNEITIQRVITMSRIKWQSTSICFVHSWKTWLLAIYSRLIVTVRLVLDNAHFRKERLNPHQLTSCMIHGYILSLNTRSNNNILFFTSPCHQIISNKSAISSSRTTINSNPISIRISHNIQMRGRTIIQPFTWSPFKIPQDTTCNTPMKLIQTLHIST